ncbi:MAG: PP2C family protein-serine/threonine phosphatase [Nocardioides sp.]
MHPTVVGRMRLFADRGVQAGLVVLLVLALLDIVLRTQSSSAYAASAIIASMLTGARRTAVVAAASVVMALASGLWRDNLGERDWLVRAVVCLALGALAVLVARLRGGREERLQRMTVIAETAQQAMLHSMPSSIGSLGLAARYISATAEARVGGDLYEVAETPYGIRVIVGDVKGKGIEAVQTAAAVLAAFRKAAFHEADVTAVARSVDAAVGLLVSDEDFVTAVVAEFSDDQVHLANCGHPAPLLISGSHTLSLDPDEFALPLGLGSEPVLTRHAWEPGSRLLLYTDGLIESRDERGEFFPLTDVAPRLAQGSLDQALDRLISQLLRHGGDEVGDDMALVLTQHNGQAGRTASAQLRASRPAR